MKRRSSARLSAREAAAPYGAPKMGRQSSTESLNGAFEGASLNGGEASSSGSRRASFGSAVTAASARAKFLALNAEAEKPKPTGKQIVSKAKFDAKVQKFETGVKGKLAAIAAKAQEEADKAPKLKSTWKSTVASGVGNYNKKTQIGDGPAGKKSLADLP